MSALLSVRLIELHSQTRPHRAELLESNVRCVASLLHADQFATEGEEVMQLLLRSLWSETGDMDSVAGCRSSGDGGRGGGGGGGNSGRGGHIEYFALCRYFQVNGKVELERYVCVEDEKRLNLLWVPVFPR